MRKPPQRQDLTHSLRSNQHELWRLDRIANLLSTFPQLPLTLRVQSVVCRVCSPVVVSPTPRPLGIPVSALLIFVQFLPRFLPHGPCTAAMERRSSISLHCLLLREASPVFIPLVHILLLILSTCFLSFQHQVYNLGQVFSSPCLSYLTCKMGIIVPKKQYYCEQACNRLFIKIMSLSLQTVTWTAHLFCSPLFPQYLVHSRCP